jgi:hypothetical protein
MTKKLEDLFNLEEKAAPVIVTELPEDLPVKDHTEVRSLDDSFKAVEAITKTLPQIVELNNLGDIELDNLATKAE